MGNFDDICSICLSDMDPKTGLCTNKDCPNSIPPILMQSTEVQEE